MKHANLSDIDAVERVVSVMYSHYTIEFHDWARSLLPEAAVVTFFLADTPVCWNVDFEIVVPEGLRRGTREAVANDATAHNLKIWAIALKYCLRRADDHKQEVTRFISRFEDTVAEEWGGLLLQMRGVLKSIEAHAGERYSHSVSMCWQIYEDDANTQN